jgi:hypothetical protein
MRFCLGFSLLLGNLCSRWMTLTPCPGAPQRLPACGSLIAPYPGRLWYPVVPAIRVSAVPVSADIDRWPQAVLPPALQKNIVFCKTRCYDLDKILLRRLHC